MKRMGRGLIAAVLAVLPWVSHAWGAPNTSLENSVCLAKTSSYSRAIAVRLRTIEQRNGRIVAEISPPEVVNGKSVDPWRVGFTGLQPPMLETTARGLTRDGWAVYQLVDVGKRQAFLVRYMFGGEDGQCYELGPAAEPVDIAGMPILAVQMYVARLGGKEKASPKSLRAQLGKLTHPLDTKAARAALAAAPPLPQPPPTAGATGDPSMATISPAHLLWHIYGEDEVASDKIYFRKFSLEPNKARNSFVVTCNKSKRDPVTIEVIPPTSLLPELGRITQGKTLLTTVMIGSPTVSVGSAGQTDDIAAWMDLGETVWEEYLANLDNAPIDVDMLDGKMKWRLQPDIEASKQIDALFAANPDIGKHGGIRTLRFSEMVERCKAFRSGP